MLIVVTSYLLHLPPSAPIMSPLSHKIHDLLVCKYVCMCVLCMCVHCVSVNGCVHVYVYVHAYAYVFVCACIHLCMSLYMCMCVGMNFSSPLSVASIYMC